MRWLNNNSEEAFYVSIGNTLKTLNISVEDVVQVEYMVKESKGVSDSDALIVLTLGNGASFITGSTLQKTNLALKFSVNDLSKVEINKTYVHGLRIKTVNMNNFMEIVLEDGYTTFLQGFFSN